MRKKGLCIALCLALMTACAPAGTQTSRTSIKVGVALYDAFDTFVSSLLEYYQKDISGYANVTVEIQDAQRSQQTQNKQVEAMLEDGCTVLCVNLVDRSAPGKVIDLARQYDVPVIFFNRELVEGDLLSWEKLYYVGGDARQSGVLQGQLALEAAEEITLDRNGDGIIQYILLEGEAGHQDAIMRSEWSVQTMIDGGLQLDQLDSAIANWERAQAQTKTNQFLSTYGDAVELILANNDDMALGAVDAYENAGIAQEERPLILGIDGTDVGLAAVKSRDLYGTVYNDALNQAQQMAALTYALAEGNPLDDFDLTQGRKILLPYRIVNQANVDYFLRLQ